VSDIVVSVTGPAPIAVAVAGATGVSPTITNGQTFAVQLAGVGPTGPRGEQGAVGPTGARGADGTAASAGATGPAGPAGPQGERGPTGSSGQQGERGATGERGLPGADGVQGAVGPAGGIGPQGIQGERGYTGPAGAAGSVGATGARGADGNVGPTGSTGARGADGNAGATGARGADGAPGSVGQTGPSGARGADGLSITGPSGPAGQVGPTGSAGPSGLSITGPSGPAGAVGPTGARGADGASITGPTGPAGGGGGSQEIFNFTTTAGFPATGATGVYIATDSGRQYRYDSSGVYVEVGPDSGSTLWSLWLPPAPTALTATAGAASASLSWTAPSVSQQTPISDYRVQVSSDNGTTWTTFADGTSTATSASVTGLTNGTAYVFRVAAINAIGQGAYTSASGSVTPGFVPSAVAGLQLWLDASDASSLFDATSGGSLVAADGAVARWQDKSGSARHATQATSESQPQRKLGVAGGRDILRFDGVDDFFDSTDFLDLTSGQQMTLFAVVKRAATGVTHAIVSKYGKSNASDSLTADGWAFRLLSSNRADFFASTDEGSGSSARLSDSTVSASGFTALTVKAAAGSLSQATIYRNSSTVASSATSSGAETLENTSHAVTVGALRYTFNAQTFRYLQFFNGDIAEVLIYNAALSDSDRAAVESYLIAKWGVL